MKGNTEYETKVSKIRSVLLKEIQTSKRNDNRIYSISYLTKATLSEQELAISKAIKILTQ